MSIALGWQMIDYGIFVGAGEECLLRTATVIKHFNFYLLILAPGVASSCPLCHTSTAEEVRQNLEITSKDPVILTGLFLPFLILGFIFWLMNTALSQSEKSAILQNRIKR